MPPTQVKKPRIQLRSLLLALLVSGCGSEAPVVYVSRAPAPAKAPALDLEQSLRLRVGENPSDLKAVTRLADLYYDRKRHGEAVPLYLEALELAPTNTAIRTDLGTCYVALEQYDKARVAYEQVIFEDPTHLNATFNMGIVENIEGNYDRAADLWSTAETLTTNQDQARQLKQMAQQARQRMVAAPPTK